MPAERKKHRITGSRSYNETGDAMTKDRSKQSFFSYMSHHFNMLWFIMALGMGGTAVAGFAFLNNSIDRGIPKIKGILYLEAFERLIPDMHGIYQAIYPYLKFHMLFFGILHIATLVWVTVLFFSWKNKRPEKYILLVNDPQKNFVMMAPVIAYGMCMNVFLVLGWVFIPWMRANLEMLLPLAAGMYTLLWAWTIWWAVKIQILTITRGLEVERMHFGWLLSPFALGMTSVTGTGIAYLAHGGDRGLYFPAERRCIYLWPVSIDFKGLDAFQSALSAGSAREKGISSGFFYGFADYHHFDDLAAQIRLLLST